MSKASETPDDAMVDIAFGLEGKQLPAGYRPALWAEVARRLPWLEDEARAGIHAVKAVETGDGGMLLPRRAKLMLRVPAARVDEAGMLSGQELDVAGFTLKLGASKVWLIGAASTLYSDFVSTGNASEELFMQDIEAELAAHGVPARLICGCARTMQVEGRHINGFALALFSVPLEPSKRLQHSGLGKERRLGCGILVQHKAITDVE